MLATTTRTLRERKALELEREKQIREHLAGRKKALEAAKRDKLRKKKTADELLRLLDLKGIEGAALRPVNTHVPVSHNLDKQLTGLVNHLFVIYPVPAFLYAACLRGSDLREPLPGTYKQWFVTLAQGGSLRKLAKDVMTSREVCAFLSAPASRRIDENVWWARMRVAGLPDRAIAQLLDRIFFDASIVDRDGRMAEVIRFYARYARQMDRVTFGEITDFVAWKLQNEPAFRFAGRTLGSMVKLTNQWHAQVQKARLGIQVEWTGLGLPDWEYEDRGRIWTVTELRNNKDLLAEGQKQKHCVFTYVHACSSGRSAIFSLRAYRKVVAGCTDDGRILWDKTCELTRVTIEATAQRSIVQVRGLMNRAPTDEEKLALRRWAGETGLVVRG